MIDIRDIQGWVRVTTTIPTSKPRTYHDSILIYVDNKTNPTVKRLYIFARDRELNQWFYIDLI